MENVEFFRDLPNRAESLIFERRIAVKVGLDVGSTTIKCVVLDDTDKLVYSTYERHFSHILEKTEELLRRTADQYLPGGRAELAISGSAGMGMAESVGIPFVQEVFATRVM